MVGTSRVTHLRKTLGTDSHQTLHAKGKIPHSVREPWIPELYRTVTPCQRLDLSGNDHEILPVLERFTTASKVSVLSRGCCLRYLQRSSSYDADDIQEILNTVGKGSDCEQNAERFRGKARLWQ